MKHYPFHSFVQWPAPERLAAAHARARYIGTLRENQRQMMAGIRTMWRDHDNDARLGYDPYDHVGRFLHPMGHASKYRK